MSSSKVKSERPPNFQPPRAGLFPAASTSRRAGPQYHFVSTDSSVGETPSSQWRRTPGLQRLQWPIIDPQSGPAYLEQQLREMGDVMTRQAVGIAQLQQLVLEHAQHLAAKITHLEYGIYGGLRELECALRYPNGEYETAGGLHCPPGAPSRTDDMAGNHDGREPGVNYGGSGATFNPLGTTQSSRH